MIDNRQTVGHIPGTGLEVVLPTTVDCINIVGTAVSLLEDETKLERTILVKSVPNI